MEDELKPLAESDRQILETVARRVVELHMEVPAVLALESVRPLSLLGSQALYFFEPVLGSLLHWPHYRRFAELIEDRDVLEHLTRTIEGLAQQSRAGAPRSGTAKGRAPGRTGGE